MRYRLTLSYVGTAYHGWQVQDNARAIQPLVQDALATLFAHRPGVSGCSRTDAGVHANVYVCHFDSDIKRDPYGVICAMNRALPRDVAVMDCAIAEEDFHARYDVKSKEYEYLIYNGKHRNPFYDGRAYYYRFPLNVEAMAKAASYYVGTHDFSSFCSVRAKEGSHVRTVTAASVCREGDLVKFRVSADGFLYNMVRIMVGTLLRVSEGKILPEQIPEIIAKQNRALSGPTAPPEGLYLNQVIY